MIPYSKIAIEYAVKKCVQQPEYKVAVAIPASKLGELKYFIKKTKFKEDEHYNLTMTRDCLTVRFSNYSALYTIVIADHTKGKPVNLVIVDDSITKEFVYNVARPIETLDFPFLK